MNLGAFSLSLNVADLDASRTFYERLGFAVTGGDAEHGYLILRNGGGTVLGLFHGMFEENILTFNPGIGPDHQPDPDFTDVREVQRVLDDAGVEIAKRIPDDSTEGAAHLVVADPDGNPVMIDQFDAEVIAQITGGSDA